LRFRLSLVLKGLGMNGCSHPSKLNRTQSNWRGTLVLALLAAVAGCGRDESIGSKSSADAIARDAANTPPPIKQVDLAHPVVRIETNLGPVTVRLDAVRAPGTVRNFLNYANGRFYDNTIVHYADPGRMIVAGGYTPERSPKPPRIPIRNEAHNGLKNRRGTIAMARDPSRIDSATSQFFINLADAPQRDYQGDTADRYGYCVFGEVIEGLDVAERISKSPTTDLGGDLSQTPEPPVVVSSVRVVR
jgi:cyclophilin family peptidyl-prolyl cis-trans isomerase